MSSTVFYQAASELATLSNTFKVSGNPTDPTAVILTVTSPTNVVTTFNWPTPATLTHGTAGVFSKDIPCNEAGEWQYLWEGTNAASDAEAGSWTVFETTLGKLYCPPQALKSRLGITSTGSDFEVSAACFAASRAIESICERIFYRTASGTVRTFVPADLYCIKLGAYNDLVTLATLATDAGGDGVYETTWAAGDYQLLPVNPSAAPETRPYTKIRAVGSKTFPRPVSTARDDLVQVTGVFGWPAVPWGVKQAAMILAEETLKLKDAPFGIAGFGEFGSVRVRENPAVARLLAPYRLYPMLVA